jgi:hypothetical protein
VKLNINWPMTLDRKHQVFSGDRVLLPKATNKIAEFNGVRVEIPIIERQNDLPMEVNKG